MGMTLPEYVLFACGAICHTVFLIRTLTPFFRSRIDNAAESTARNLRQDFLSLSSDQVRGILLSAGAVFALAATMATRDIFWILVVGSSPVLLCGMVVRHVHARRRKRIVSQLPVFLEILSGHVKAGHSIPESLQEAIPLLPPGIREEVHWLCQSIRLGTPLPDALRVWERRMACGEISLIVRPLCIAIPAGGNLYDLLTRCRDMLRAKMRQVEKMRSMTAQARLQALVLTLLPPGFIAVLSKIEPGYLARCRETSAGKTLLAIAAVLQLLGWLSIRRIMAGNR
ncbi:MAG TPA: type II secretion system F family protein [Candidatus Deferrimicrobiaceae bacterium]|nr:type II secretion system F family protein [Candidatus Deferrimicrobiaceae bacterium]